MKNINIKNIALMNTFGLVSMLPMSHFHGFALRTVNHGFALRTVNRPYVTLNDSIYFYTTFQFNGEVPV